ncbi:MAG: hypothetical protein R2856_29995 [Caldilineaceae bacterium]
MRRACKPTWLSPISPSISARGTNAAVVYHHHVHCAGANQCFGDLQRLLAGVGLADVEILHVDADLPVRRPDQGVFHVDKATDAAVALRFGDHVQTHGRLAGTFRPVDLDDTPAGIPPTPSAISRLRLPVGSLRCRVCWRHPTS